MTRLETRVKLVHFVKSWKVLRNKAAPLRPPEVAHYPAVDRHHKKEQEQPPDVQVEHRENVACCQRVARPN